MSGRGFSSVWLWIATLFFLALLAARDIGALKRRCTALESRVAALEAKQ